MLISMSAPEKEATAATENEATAVVGIACRLPGAPDPDAFWRLLDDGVSAVGNPPPGRFRASANTANTADVADTADSAADANVRPGAFLQDVDRFDPEFFGMSPAEAAAADPQQRLVLELAWEALEDAGILPPTSPRPAPACSSERSPPTTRGWSTGTAPTRSPGTP